MSQSFDSYNSVLQVTEPASNIKCSSSRTDTSELLKSCSHFKMFVYVCFCFTSTILFMQTMFYLTKKQCLTRDIELIIKYRVIWIPSVLAVLSLRTFSREVKVVQ